MSYQKSRTRFEIAVEKTPSGAKMSQFCWLEVPQKSKWKKSTKYPVFMKGKWAIFDPYRYLGPNLFPWPQDRVLANFCSLWPCVCQNASALSKNSGMTYSTYYPLSNISTSRNKRTSWQNLEFLSFVHHGINIHHGKIRCRTSWMYVVLIKYGINVHHGLFWITHVRTSWNKHRTSWKLMNSTASVHVLLFDSG